ncbi:SPOR domain-containing protein [Sphingobium chlorophenolicum]|uniref:Sporulation domain-containing protein n=1 Tax=Sphingobium chlorophenolicum TaxID=46429 RepID=A0A081RGB4_SPHCR|nr:SPOR domain-containing protein [Sphingobium chlorophenolicum]KEQ54237.1 Sporulation domain-containing protein precursor [Sphingobium chlorophenolicum]
MKRKAFAKAAVASMLVGTTMVGCTGAAFRNAGHVGAIAPKQNPDRLAAQVEKALAERDGVRAVELAEAAVQAAPQDVRHRQLLGRAYVAAGRFASAETALTDAMTLGNRDARTIITLALVEVALGKDRAARDLLATQADIVPAADYGLAMAMAGDAAEGVRILSEVIHDPSATAQTRQNLAYAYALAGRWKDARMMAGFDLDPLAANERITQWAQNAAPGLSQQRVATLMGVAIDRADAGQPVALALASAPVQMAQAAPVEQPGETAPVETAPVETAAADTAPQPVVAEEAPAPAIQTFAAPARSAALRHAAAPARIQKAAFSPSGKGGSNWVVQLGAYDNAAIAKEKWYAMASRNSALANLPVVTSQITLNGATFSRLAVSGFDDRAEAAALCRTIQARRGKCFVRENAVDATPQRWALTTRARQYASR